MPNIQDFANRGLQGDLPQGLQARQPRPQVNFGGPQQPIAQQQMSESTILGKLLSGALGGGLPGGAAPGLQQLQAAILQKGRSDALQSGREQAGIQQSANVPFRQLQPDIGALQQAQGLNLRRF